MNEENIMGYKNKELLTNWADNIDKVAELTKHSTTRTAKKTQLSELLNTVSRKNCGG